MRRVAPSVVTGPRAGGVGMEVLALARAEAARFIALATAPVYSPRTRDSLRKWSPQARKTSAPSPCQSTCSIREAIWLPRFARCGMIAAMARDRWARTSGSPCAMTAASS
ncbi:hypothetical protein [Streptomyces hoynatensis]|uniref:hypothetical protein n=1 Tax=Streptomyces hoynatensis TaxID=1141874 RepID=UPI0019D4DC20|nr:hypothetical protein [Streptomyces hoynatensis]